MNRKQALHYVGYYLDNSLNVRLAAEMPENARLVGWQCGFEPMFVAVWSYFGGVLDGDEAAEIATDYLAEIKWFSGEPEEPDYII